MTIAAPTTKHEPGEFIGVSEVVRRTGWGTSRCMRLALIGEVEHRLLPGGVLQFKLADVERVLDASK